MTSAASPTSTDDADDDRHETGSVASLARTGADDGGRDGEQREPVGSGRAAGPHRPGDWHRWWPWLVGIAAGLLTLGPALAPGSLFSLDLVLTPQIPVPAGVWGLGPELPRRVPLMLPAAWLSPIIPGWLTGKAMIVGSIAVAFVGVHRLVRDRSELAAVGAGLLFAINPFMLTRVGVGHLALVVAMAILPWALPTLLRPGERPYRTFLWCFALGFTGNYGGMIALFLVVAGLINTRGRNVWKVAGAWLVAQLPWLLPGLFVLNQGAALGDAATFTTIGRGVAGKAQILAGHGFWNYPYQAGFTGEQQRLEDQLPVAITALVLLALAIYGARDLPREWRWAAASLAGVGAFLAIISSFEYDANPYFALTRNPIGANLRESLRTLPLYLVWMAPGAALGATRLARSIAARGSDRSLVTGAGAQLVRAIPLGAALFLSASGMWGLEGHLRSAQIPAGWEQVRAQVAAEPGTVLALPWSAYNVYDLGGPHLVINPWPFYLGGDVLICSDPGRRSDCGSPSGDAERADTREVAAGHIAGDARAGRPVARQLADLGVRWVLLAHVPGAEQYALSEPGLERTVASDTVDLYRVGGWRGLIVADDGRVVDARPIVEPLTSVDASGAAVYARAASPGWRRGLTVASATDNGLLRLPEGSGPVWYWPTIVVFAGYGACALVLVLAGRDERRSRQTPVRDR